MQPHIIQIIPTPTGGGAEVLVRELGQSIASENFTSEVIYFNSNIKLKKNIQYHENESELGVSSSNFFAIFKLRSILKKRILEYDDVLVHAHLTWPFYFVALATLFLNVKLIYTEHSTVNKRRKIDIIKYFERYVYRRYLRFICISNGVQESLGTWVGSRLATRMIVVPNGARMYELKHRSPLQNSSKIKFVSVGSLTKKKGFSTAIRAISELRESVESYKVIGEGPERGHLELLIAELGLEKKIHLVGWSDAIESYFHEADIQLIPSIWEGFGLVAVEGMSTGLPVVASNVDGLREVLNPDNPGTFLVDNYQNPTNWVDAIQNCILRTQSDRLVIENAARGQAEHFGLKRMVSEYSKIYKEIFES
ncbi:glycosyltransferase [Desulfoplanes sp. PS50]